MAYFVEMTGFDLVAQTDKTFRFAKDRTIAFADSPSVAPALSGLVKFLSPTQKVEVSESGAVVQNNDNGVMQIANMPTRASAGGSLDDLAGYVWAGRQVKLFWTPDGTYANRALAWKAVLEQPTGSLSIDGGVNSYIEFILRDPRSTLTTTLQTTKFQGDNKGANGAEGEANLQGVPKPILYGSAFNILPPCVNTPRLLFQVCDKSANLLSVRDGGVPLGVGTKRGTLQALKISAPAAGKYDWYAGAEGTFFKLGSSPVYQICCDAREGTAATNSHAQIWKRFRTERCDNVVGEINAASITAADALDHADVGFYWDSETTRAEAMSQILGSFSGYEVMGDDFVWRIYKLVAPTGTTTIDLITLDQNVIFSSKHRALRKFQKVRPNFAPKGVPPYRIKVYWGENYHPMSDGDFAGSVVPVLRYKLRRQWRCRNRDNTAIWNPDTKTGPWKNAPELSVYTGYQPGGDGNTSPDASAEGARLIALYSALKGQYQASFSPKPGDKVLPGQVISIKHGAYNLAPGRLFLVLQSSFSLDNSGAEIDMVVGFQT